MEFLKFFFAWHITFDTYIVDEYVYFTIGSNYDDFFEDLKALAKKYDAKVSECDDTLTIVTNTSYKIHSQLCEYCDTHPFSL